MSATPFLFSCDMEVRGYELDAWGHVNNAVYLNYLEHARWQMGRQMPLFDTQALDLLPVVRHVTLDYRCETRMHDQLRVSLWPRRIGTTSFTLGGGIVVRAADDPARVGQLALLATMVLTCVRRPQGTVPVPDSWRPHFPAQDPGEGLPPQA